MGAGEHCGLRRFAMALAQREPVHVQIEQQAALFVAAHTLAVLQHANRVVDVASIGVAVSAAAVDARRENFDFTFAVEAVDVTRSEKPRNRMPSSAPSAAGKLMPAVFLGASLTVSRLRLSMGFSVTTVTDCEMSRNCWRPMPMPAYAPRSASLPSGASAVLAHGCRFERGFGGCGLRQRAERADQHQCAQGQRGGGVLLLVGLFASLRGTNAPRGSVVAAWRGIRDGEGGYVREEEGGRTDGAGANGHGGSGSSRLSAGCTARAVVAGSTECKQNANDSH